MTTADTVRTLAAGYRGLTDGAHKQIGLRALRNARACQNDKREFARLIESARFHLPRAIAVHDLSTGGYGFDYRPGLKF